MISVTWSDASVAMLLGGSLGVGVSLVLAAVPRWGAPSLERRIAPYLRDIADPLGLTPPPVPIREGGRFWRTLQGRMDALLGGSASVRRRLGQAGRGADVMAFRGRQLGWAVAGLALGGAVVVGSALWGRFSAPVAALPVVVAAGLAFAYDALLTRAARARLQRIADELPTVLEFLALCLAAGEGILDALRRVGGVGAGELTGELRGVVLAVDTGSPLGEALSAHARNVEMPALTRSVDHLIAALDRGAPLAQVLQAQAADAREDAKRVLIERAGRKEILMLLPLVFLILPLSILFAVFPGIFILRLGVG